MRAVKFKQERGRLPSITSPRRVGEADGRGRRRLQRMKAEAPLWLSFDLDELAD